jgi:hypothetical protein
MLPLSKGVQQEGIRVAHQQIFNARMFDQQKPADTEAIFASFGLAPPWRHFATTSESAGGSGIISFIPR